MKHKRTKVGETILAYAVLIVLSFLCLFLFLHSDRQRLPLPRRPAEGLQLAARQLLPGKSEKRGQRRQLPHVQGHHQQPDRLHLLGGAVHLLLRPDGLRPLRYQFKLKKVAFTFIMAILVMPTQVTAMGFLRLMTNIGLYDSLLPLIIPSIASPAVFYFMYSYLSPRCPSPWWRPPASTAPVNSGPSTASCFPS